PGSWAVVLDIDETALDNSTYQLDRTAYGLAFESTSWNAWIQRREAPAVPGVADFVAAVRRLGGRVAWISDRDAPLLRDATRAHRRRRHARESPRPRTARRRRSVLPPGAGADESRAPRGARLGQGQLRVERHAGHGARVRRRSDGRLPRCRRAYCRYGHRRRV